MKPGNFYKKRSRKNGQRFFISDPNIVFKSLIEYDVKHYSSDALFLFVDSKVILDKNVYPFINRYVFLDENGKIVWEALGKYHNVEDIFIEVKDK